MWGANKHMANHLPLASFEVEAVETSSRHTSAFSDLGRAVNYGVTNTFTRVASLVIWQKGVLPRQYLLICD